VGLSWRFLAVAASASRRVAPPVRVRYRFAMLVRAIGRAALLAIFAFSDSPFTDAH